MPIRVEIYGADGVAIAVVARDGTLRDLVEAGGELLLERVTWHPLDGSPARPAGRITFAPDDIHIAVTDTSDDAPVHAQWHDVAVELGPYRVSGQMPTMPGFDPGRALARPTGEFVLLRDVQISLVDREDAGSVRHRTALVNRYVVDRVEADLMLGFFFPGAEMVVTGGGDSVAHLAGQTGLPLPTAGEASASTPPDDVPDPDSPAGVAGSGAATAVTSASVSGAA
jgi:hypothetical protein